MKKKSDAAALQRRLREELSKGYSADRKAISKDSRKKKGPSKNGKSPRASAKTGK